MDLLINFAGICKHMVKKFSGKGVKKGHFSKRMDLRKKSHIFMNDVLRLTFLFHFIYISCAWSAWLSEGSLQIGGGYRQDQLKWNISGPNKHPDILSELEWKDLRIWQIAIQPECVLWNHLYLSVEGDYGWIVDGHNRDSDYLGSCRTKEFCRSVSQADEGNVCDGSLGIGYVLDQNNCAWRIFPLIGYSGHLQHLKMIGGKVLIHPYSGGLGSMNNLHSSYQACWYGPWVGIKTSYQPSEVWKLEAAYEYHIGHYRGRGHWNLRIDMPDGFWHQTNQVDGHVFYLEGHYYFWVHYFVGAKILYQNWNAEHGLDITPLVSSEGQYQCAYTELNHVNWNSYLFQLQIGFCF